MPILPSEPCVSTNLKAQNVLLIWTILTTAKQSQAEYDFPNLGILDLLQTYLTPYLPSLRLDYDAHSALRTESETPIQTVIRLKVEELKPLLQDDDEDLVNSDNLTVDINDDTVIIELKPLRIGDSITNNETDSFKKRIHKYKKKRKQIGRMMDDERILPETKSKVMTLLNELIAHVVGSQCSWKANIETPDLLYRRYNLETRRAIEKVQNITDDEWASLKNKYLNFLNFRNNKETGFIKQFTTFFQTMLLDVAKRFSYHKIIRCEIINPERHKSTININMRNSDRNKGKCNYFKMCSEELKAFLDDCFKRLNDTIVNVFKNYAAMYVRDMNVETNEKDTVAKKFKKLTSDSEQRVAKVFKKVISNFTLDEHKNKNNNMLKINDFIRNTIKRMKKSVEKLSNTILDSMKIDLVKAVKTDVINNLQNDLNDTERTLIDKTCTTFSVCNRKYFRRSNFYIPSKAKPNDLYVNVELPVDDETKDNPEKGGFFRRSDRGGDHRLQYNHYINVTRTSTMSDLGGEVNNI